MSTWMRTDFDFGVSWIIFEVPARALAACKIRDIVRDKQEDPSAIATALEELVRFYRPDLAGGQVVNIEMGRGGMCWQFWYTHPSLPRVQVGNRPEAIELIPSVSSPGKMFRQYT